ncbi:DNA polymerase kappa-like [Tubulanus polymorphus]|uniref:DNA polymerase kappa-like n=1 Tax=Tubulanus polymorphus TaxID=672921 RepID=UPI003DA39BB5
MASSTSAIGEKPLMGLTLNDNKAGMQSLDKARINQIIFDASKGSKFYEKELKKEDEIRERIRKQQQILEQVSPQQIASTKIMVEQMIESLECERELNRIIVHVDMDAFYAAVEMRDDETLRDKPMAVGGNSMLSTSNYIARRYGVRAAMPGFIARKLCPELVIVPPDFEKYTSVSKEIRSVLAEYDEHFCPMSLDEAYLDLTKHVSARKNYPLERRTFVRNSDVEDRCVCGTTSTGNQLLLDANGNEMAGDSYDLDRRGATGDRSTHVCTKCNKNLSENVIVFGTSVAEAVREMRFKIQQKTKLTASAGIAPNMMLAKVCSDRNKPNGQFEIALSREAVIEFIKDLPLRKICGIGKVTEKMLSAIGVVTCTDLYNNLACVYHLYSKISFNYFLRVCLGLGSTRVERDEGRKSISTERTFTELYRPEDLFAKCTELVEALVEDLKLEKITGKTVTIKLKTISFEIRTRALTMADYTNDFALICCAARRLLTTEIQRVAPEYLRIRLLGVRLSNLQNAGDAVARSKQQTIKSLLTVNHHRINELDSCKVDSNDESSADASSSRATARHGNDSSAGSASNHVEKEPSTSENKTETGARNSDADMSDQHCDLGLSKPKIIDSAIKNTDSKVTDTHHQLRDCEIANEVSKSETNVENSDSPGVIVENLTATTDCDLPSPIARAELEFATADTNLETVYMCPVCNRDITCHVMRDFNDHLDACLSSREVADRDDKQSDISVIRTISKTKVKVKQPPATTKRRKRNSSQLSSKKKDTSLNGCDIKTWITDSQDISSNFVNDEDDERAADEQSQRFVCPICNLPQPKLKDLASFNDHVDGCLSRGTIHTILQEQKQLDSSLKRKNTSLSLSQPSHAKRKKMDLLPLSQTTTIDSFFR